MNCIKSGHGGKCRGFLLGLAQGSRGRVLPPLPEIENTWGLDGETSHVYFCMCWPGDVPGINEDCRLAVGYMFCCSGSALGLEI